MRAHGTSTRVSRTKVLWALVALCGARTLHAQPTPTVKTDVPLISLDEALHILDESSRVTLSFKDALPGEIFAEFSRQTHVPVRLPEFDAKRDAFEKPVSIELKDVPFWDAVKELEQQMQVSFNPNMPRGGFEVWPGGPARKMPTPPRRRPKETEGRQVDFEHALGSMKMRQGQYSRSLRFDNFNTQVFESLRMEVEAQLDPRLQIVALAQNARIEIADDEMGRSLILPTKPGPVDERWNTAVVRGFSDFNVPLKPNTGTRIAHFKGTCRVRVATRSEAWEITDLLKMPQARRITRLGIEQTLNVLSLQREGRTWQVNLLIQNEGPLRLRLPAGTTSFGTLRLLNAQNRDFQWSGSAGGGGDNDVRNTFSFSVGPKDDLGEPAKLIWMIPVEWKEIDLPFEFHDVPLS